MAAREPNQLRVRNKCLGTDAPEVDLTARKQVGQTAYADAQHARGALAVIEKELMFH